MHAGILAADKPAHRVLRQDMHEIYLRPVLSADGAGGVRAAPLQSAENGKAMNRLDRAYRLVPKIACRGLCVESCDPVIPSEAEEERIARRHHTRVDHDRKTFTCTLLKDGKCSIYENRPLLCRYWGVVEKMPCVFGCTPEGGFIAKTDEKWALRLVYER